MKLRSILIFMACLKGIAFAQHLDEDSLMKTLKKQGYKKALLEEVFEHEKRIFNEKNAQKTVQKNGLSIEQKTSSEPKNYPERHPSYPLPEMFMSEVESGCSTINFEQGSLDGWEGRTGFNNGVTEYGMVDGLVEGRHTLFGLGSGFDMYGGFSKVHEGGNFSLMLGNNDIGAQSESISYTFTVDAENKFYSYYYAVVLQNPGDDHVGNQRPRFMARLIHNDETVDCSEFTATANDGLPGFVYNRAKGVWYKPWSYNVINLSDYIGQEVTVMFQTYDCAFGGHFGYAYIDGDCLTQGIDYADKNDCGRYFEFSSLLIESYEDPIVSWNFGDDSTSTEFSPDHLYAADGTYTVTLHIESGLKEECSITIEREIEIIACDPLPCESCVPSFAPTPGRYIVSAWVKEDGAGPSTQSYANTSIEVSFDADPPVTLTPSGKIIDGWQRIEEEITVPEGAGEITIKLLAASGESYFDDIRFFPFDGSMMSYVYDPVSLRLMAELDERNYASLYEYDEEGKLVRVKKETEKGIMTIQENRENLMKK